MTDDRKKRDKSMAISDTGLSQEVSVERTEILKDIKALEESITRINRDKGRELSKKLDQLKKLSIDNRTIQILEQIIDNFKNAIKIVGNINDQIQAIEIYVSNGDRDSEDDAIECLADLEKEFKKILKAIQRDIDGIVALGPGSEEAAVSYSEDISTSIGTYAKSDLPDNIAKDTPFVANDGSELRDIRHKEPSLGQSKNLPAVLEVKHPDLSIFRELEDFGYEVFSSSTLQEWDTSKIDKKLRGGEANKIHDILTGLDGIQLPSGLDIQVRKLDLRVGKGSDFEVRADGSVYIAIDLTLEDWFSVLQRQVLDCKEHFSHPLEDHPTTIDTNKADIVSPQEPYKLFDLVLEGDETKSPPPATSPDTAPMVDSNSERAPEQKRILAKESLVRDLGGFGGEGGSSKQFIDAITSYTAKEKLAEVAAMYGVDAKTMMTLILDVKKRKENFKSAKTRVLSICPKCIVSFDHPEQDFWDTIDLDSEISNDNIADLSNAISRNLGRGVNINSIKFTSENNSKMSLSPKDGGVDFVLGLGSRDWLQKVVTKLTEKSGELKERVKIIKRLNKIIRSEFGSGIDIGELYLKQERESLINITNDGKLSLQVGLLGGDWENRIKKGLREGGTNLLDAMESAKNKVNSDIGLPQSAGKVLDGLRSSNAHIIFPGRLMRDFNLNIDQEQRLLGELAQMGAIEESEELSSLGGEKVYILSEYVID